MVQYLPTVSNEISILVKSVQVNTSLILSGPAEVYQGTTFMLTAMLKRNDTNVAIPNAPIKFYRGTTLLGSGTTNVSGIATLNLSMTETGTYRFTAAFEGMEVAGLSLMPSMGSYTVGGVNLLPILAVLGAAYLLTRKH